MTCNPQKHVSLVYRRVTEEAEEILHIQPQEVLDVNVQKVKLDYNTLNSTGHEFSRKKAGIQSNLYEARNNLTTQENDELTLKQAIKRLHPLTALGQIMNDSCDSKSHAETLYGKSPRGSYSVYQLYLINYN